MANIFELCEYHTFGLMKMLNISEICFVNDKWNLWKKFDLWLTDRQKYYFLIFPFSFFQVSNKYSQKSYSGFRKL